MLEVSMPSAKERVTEKLSLKSDIQNSKIRTSINNVEQTDGKITATFNINGLPTPKNNSFEDSYRNISKIFDDMSAFNDYATAFFSKSDEEITELAKNAK